MERKAKRIRTQLIRDPEQGIYEKGLKPENVRSKFASPNRSAKRILARALTRPFAMIFYEHIIQLLGLYMAFIYGLVYRQSISFAEPIHTIAHALDQCS